MTAQNNFPTSDCVFTNCFCNHTETESVKSQIPMNHAAVCNSSQRLVNILAAGQSCGSMTQAGLPINLALKSAAVKSDATVAFGMSVALIFPR